VISRSVNDKSFTGALHLKLTLLFTYGSSGPPQPINIAAGFITYRATPPPLPTTGTTGTTGTSTTAIPGGDSSGEFITTGSDTGATDLTTSNGINTGAGTSDSPSQADTGSQIALWIVCLTVM
jgi:hypothetical protein